MSATERLQRGETFPASIATHGALCGEELQADHVHRVLCPQLSKRVVSGAAPAPAAAAPAPGPHVPPAETAVITVVLICGRGGGGGRRLLPGGSPHQEGAFHPRGAIVLRQAAVQCRRHALQPPPRHPTAAATGLRPLLRQFCRKVRLRRAGVAAVPHHHLDAPTPVGVDDRRELAPVRAGFCHNHVVARGEQTAATIATVSPPQCGPGNGITIVVAAVAVAVAVAEAAEGESLDR